MIDQSKDLVDTVKNGNDILDKNFNEFVPDHKLIKLPKFSLKSIARKTLRSFIKWESHLLWEHFCSVFM